MSLPWNRTTRGDKGLLFIHLSKIAPVLLFQFEIIPFFSHGIRPFRDRSMDGLALQLSLTSVLLLASMFSLVFAVLNASGGEFTKFRKIGAGLEAAGGLNLFLCGLRTALEERSGSAGMEFGLTILMILVSGIFPFLFMGFTLIAYDREKE